MEVNQLSTLFISTLLYSGLALEVCRNTDNTNCQSCGNTVYPRDEIYRQNCMRSCGVCTVTSIATRRPTNQSSTYNDSRLPFNYSHSRNAVDRNIDNHCENGHCSHTQDDKPIWWCVDLQGIYNINSMTIYNRNRFEERLQGFEIKISYSGTCNQTGFQSATSCYKDTTSTQSVYNVTGCNQRSYKAFSGRTVYVSVSSQSLTLCEVLIYSAQCNTGYYSISSCTCQPCNTCYNNTCNPDTGDCNGGCKTGFYGKKCQQNCNDGCVNNQCSKSNGRCTNCITGRYGHTCGKNCNTGCDGGCDRDGRCTNCIIGRYGDRCDKNCSTGCDGGCDRGFGKCTNCITGRYGDECDMDCSTGCYGGCDKTDSKCTSCIKGKTGDRCDIDCTTDCAVCNQDEASSCTECNDGRWGPSCNKLCNTNCKPVVGTTVGKCDQMTGNCINGYVSGTTELLPVVVYVVSGALGGIIGTVAVFLSYNFYMKRRQSSQRNEEIVPDLNPASSTIDDTFTTGYPNIPTNTRSVEYENQSFNTEDNTRNMYDTVDHTSDDTQNVYTSIHSKKPN
ncbi:multiple epidermal growth factor-like domains protein 10 isoform X2 [Patella vulgata]|nr:multiple epidermal growth factor-like domains protein 10 isoform X2 [Patella vulgata]